MGYTVIHDKTIHDDSYPDSYPNSRETINRILEENPQIQIVIDIHRDSITLDDGTRMRPVLFSQRKYNMDVTRCSLLIEMGSEANTLEQACYSGRLLASALGSLMERYTEE